MVNFQVPVKLDAGRRWLEAGQTLVSGQAISHMCSLFNFSGPRGGSEVNSSQYAFCCDKASGLQAASLHHPYPTIFAVLPLAGQVLQMELMFSKLASLETDAKASDKATNGVEGGDTEEGGQDEEDVLTLEPVTVQRFEASLSGGHWGLHAYVPVTFSGVHFVRVDCMVGFAAVVVTRCLSRMGGGGLCH